MNQGNKLKTTTVINTVKGKNMVEQLRDSAWFGGRSQETVPKK